ncbi:FAD-binding protein [Alphaproteobacteria bacterium KMM 3653]|uniref:FAD-binding protein n=1 Tax=Harenicola maris TaxID=2841044 RepID=A0AAP2CTN5_9RHOB|nr:FAD-binding protein [Harenicola maris]
MTPTTEAELAEAIGAATSPLRIKGGGTRVMPGAGEGLSTRGLSGISLYEPGALTVVAGAGTPLAEVEAALEAEGQMLPFEPGVMRGLLGTHGEPTIGGAVACNASGPRRVQLGACRDFLIGLRFVDGAGRVLKNGGRVMKNVTGYDLVKLLCGSYGTLGVISEVAFKVLPKPETTATLIWRGGTFAEDLQVMTEALCSPFGVTGAARGHDGDVLIRVEGMAGSVAYRSAQLRLLAGRAAARIETDASANDALWRDIRDVTCFAGQPGRIWRTSVKPSDMPAIAALPHRHMVDWGGGLIWTLTEENIDLRAQITAPGHSTLLRGCGAPLFHPEPPPIAALSAGLRAKFDPRGILNPGLMG